MEGLGHLGVKVELPIIEYLRDFATNLEKYKVV